MKLSDEHARLGSRIARPGSGKNPAKLTDSKWLRGPYIMTEDDDEQRSKHMAVDAQVRYRKRNLTEELKRDDDAVG